MGRREAAPQRVHAATPPPPAPPVATRPKPSRPHSLRRPHWPIPVLAVDDKARGRRPCRSGNERLPCATPRHGRCLACPVPEHGPTRIYSLLVQRSRDRFATGSRHREGPHPAPRAWESLPGASRPACAPLTLTCGWNMEGRPEVTASGPGRDTSGAADPGSTHRTRLLCGRAPCASLSPSSALRKHASGLRASRVGRARVPGDMRGTVPARESENLPTDHRGKCINGQ